MIRTAGLLLFAFAFSAAPPLAAQVRPQPGPGDPRVQTVDYDTNQVVSILAATGYRVSLEFAPDEQIENIAVGDSGSWQVTANRRGDRLFIKPLRGGVTTNMTVVTDVRLYAFELAPLDGPSRDMAYAIRFRYPSTTAESTPLPPQAPTEGRYKISGVRALRPSAISDDGIHTYIEWPRDRAIPAVYAVGANDNEALVNGMMRDDIFVIDAIARRLVFRIDRKVARAERIVPKRKP